jgi:hypothetical protein
MTPMGTDILAPIKAAIEEFEAVQRKHRSLGAYDSEPDGVAQVYFARAAIGTNLDWKNTARSWELYCSKRGVGVAARELTSAARKAVTVIKRARAKDSIAVVRWARDFCNRVDVDGMISRAMYG